MTGVWLCVQLEEQLVVPRYFTRDLKQRKPISLVPQLLFATAYPTDNTKWLRPEYLFMVPLCCCSLLTADCSLLTAHC